jgi:hypothetical protein
MLFRMQWYLPNIIGLSLHSKKHPDPVRSRAKLDMKIYKTNSKIIFEPKRELMEKGDSNVLEAFTNGS